MTSSLLQQWVDGALSKGFPPHQVFQVQWILDTFIPQGEELLFWFLLFEAGHRDRGHLRLPLDSQGLSRSIEDWDRGWEENEEWILQHHQLQISLKEKIPALMERYSVLFTEKNSPYLIEDHCLYTRRQWEREHHFIDSFLAHFPQSNGSVFLPGLGQWNPLAVEEAAQNLKQQGVQVSPESINALERLFRSPVSVISGGPGTGKTTTLVFILSLLQQLNKQNIIKEPRIFLAAPTGRAAKRMEEAVRQRSGQEIQAGTLHKLLGLTGNRQREAAWNRSHSLPADLVVVDEASMVDVSLMYHLLQALSPETSLLLVGDKDQLPSVDSGALLGDLLEQSENNDHPLNNGVTYLHQVFRSGKEILELAGMIRQGQTTAEDLFLKYSGGEGSVKVLPFPEDLQHWSDPLARNFPLPPDRSFFCSAEELEKVRSQIERWFAVFEHLVILSPLRQGSFGVDRLNPKILQQLYGSEGEIHHGQPLMITRNDYELNLFNGDRGILFRFKDIFYALFPEDQGWRALPLVYLKHWETCYAQTIHKSQGSEYDKVLIVLPPGGGSLLYRELLYTAVTRARHQVTLMADKNSLNSCLQKGVYRSSGISALRFSASGS